VQQRLKTIRLHLDQAYVDNPDGKIPVDFWPRRTMEWHVEEQNVLLLIQALAEAHPDQVLTVTRILELANRAHFL